MVLERPAVQIIYGPELWFITCTGAVGAGVTTVVVVLVGTGSIGVGADVVTVVVLWVT